MHEAIAAALAELERDGTLSASQRAEVERRLAAALAPPDRRGRFAAVVAVLGAVLLAAGLLYLVGYHWDRLGKATQLALVFGIWAGVHVAGYRCTVAPGHHPRLGVALTTLGVLCFGGAIGLVAQIYHLDSRYPNAVLAWWLLGIPVLLWSRTRAVQLAVTGIFLVWAPWHVTVWIDDLPDSRWPLLPVAIGLLFAGLGALFAGLADAVAGTCFATFAGPWRGLAWFAALLAPFLLGFHQLWSEGPLHGSSGTTSGALLAEARPWLFPALALAVGGIGAAVAAARGRRRDLAAPFGVVATSAAVLALGCAAAPDPIAMPILANVVQLALIVLLARLGAARDRAGLSVLAVVTFAIAVFARYVEHLWDKLAGAFAFLGLGALLLLLGWALERQLRRHRARRAEVHP